MTRQTEPSPRLMWSSRMNCVTCVVFPHPVSPLTTSTWLELMSLTNSWRQEQQRQADENEIKTKRKRAKQKKIHDLESQNQLLPLFYYKMEVFPEMSEEQRKCFNL